MPLSQIPELSLRLARAFVSNPEVRAAGVPRTVAKCAQVLRSGDEDSIFVLEHGLVKICFLPPDGKEWIRSFVSAPGLFGQPFLQSPEEDGTFSVVGIENCTW